MELVEQSTYLLETGQILLFILIITFFRYTSLLLELYQTGDRKDAPSAAYDWREFFGPCWYLWSVTIKHDYLTVNMWLWIIGEWLCLEDVAIGVYQAHRVIVVVLVSAWNWVGGWIAFLRRFCIAWALIHWKLLCGSVAAQMFFHKGRLSGLSSLAIQIWKIFHPRLHFPASG